MIFQNFFKVVLNVLKLFPKSVRVSRGFKKYIRDFKSIRNLFWTFYFLESSKGSYCWMMLIQLLYCRTTHMMKSSKGENWALFRASNAYNFFWAGNNINNVYIERKRNIRRFWICARRSGIMQRKVDFNSEPVQVGNDQNHHFS